MSRKDCYKPQVYGGLGGKFSVSESYKHLLTDNVSVSDINDEKTWKVRAPQKTSNSSQSLLASTEAWARSLFGIGGPYNWSCTLMTKGWWQFLPHGWTKMVIRLSDIFQVEAQALVEGLKLAWAK
ncbi:hypothetical protein GOBAR_DD19709 [Gossypium barbadense]|nr:hypothetical protein GOBAR_DD19709 [Gossypium barbadense]